MVYNVSLKSTLKKPVYPIDDNVSRAFLCAMVSLIGGYRDALRLKPVSIMGNNYSLMFNKSTGVGALFGILGRVVPPGSPNPDPI